ncbi:MAG: hypothetical protein CMA21_00535 [Euryarchaeota archaeon]|nr:hypothetical protein [Euryarchaeota archaeon]
MNPLSRNIMISRTLNANIYPLVSAVGPVSWRLPLSAMMASMIVLMAFGPVSSAQIGVLPSIEITCDDPDPIEVWPGATRSTIVNCTLENPSIHSESVEIGTGSDEGNFEFVAPESVTIGSGQEVDIQVLVRATELHPEGVFNANITAKVTQANGIDVGAFTSEEEAVVSVEVMSFGSCEVMMGQGGGSIDAGDPVVFAASFVCQSNTDFSIGYSLIMIEEGSISSAWPSGFEDQSALCEFQVQAGGGGGNCQFQVSTPSNLASAWNGCVVLIDNDGDGDGSGSVAPSSCSSDTPSLGVNVDPQGLSLGAIGLDGNSSLTDLAMENKEVVGGALGGLILLVSLVIVLRRRSREYDEWEED